MPKAKSQKVTKKTPYTRDQNKDKKNAKTKKPLNKSEKLRNADLTESLDDLLGDLQQHLAPKKKKPLTLKNNTMEDTSKIEEEQRLYEKTQNDIDAALNLLDKL
ncbi:hypothetical protein A0J61_05163 [Choanephora cucurbitarum]|uniref:Uncharacterized protein n=1 Tax=Choanephora cucurbitarum TaxID=101091 RepID=A0A1C7NDZ5_9FUNG|nr:hypothetical protein A0J61_05163 [Choanephora cucurbitarum]